MIKKNKIENKKIELKKFKLKKTEIFISIFVILLILATLLIIKSSYTKNKDTNINTNDQLTIDKTQTIDSPEFTTGTINPSSKLEDFYGKPSLIVFAGTYCGHCQNMVPELETEIWNNYKLEANIWVNVIDGSSGKRFEVKDIAQGYNPNLDYDEIMGNCGYVPSYVVLDKEGNQILRSCGAEKTIEEIKQAIDSQLK